MPAKILNGLAEVYYKPTTGQVVFRKIGVRKTDKWQEKVLPKVVNFEKVFTGLKGDNSLAKRCAGKKWSQFKACLRREGMKTWDEAAKAGKVPAAKKRASTV